MGLELNLVPLRLGPLAPPGFHVRRSGIRWLREDGGLCRAGEAVAFCNIGLTRNGDPREIDAPFAEEWLDVQAVLAPRIAGRIRRSEASSRGGFLDQLDHFQLWKPDFVIGQLERIDDAGPALPGAEDEVELFMTAGRRHADLAEGRQGILTGWNDRSRAWRANGDGSPGAVLSLGTCEMTGVMRGENLAFLELFEAIGGPAHAVYVADEPLAPRARVIIEQLARTESQRQAIAADLVAYFAKASPRPAEWIFIGALLNALNRCPLGDEYDILSRTSLRRAGPADAVVLSASAESPSLLRHRRLGYAVEIHPFRAFRAGPTVRAWLDGEFEPVRRCLDDIAQDYQALIGALRAAPGLPKHVLIANMMSSAGDDDVQSYQGFDAPMGETLASIRAKDINLLLHDLAREPEVAVIDVDAIAADMGGQRNLPDGVHASGALQTEARGEILHVLRARGVPGFGPALA
jgi:hypothetical protein